MDGRGINEIAAVSKMLWGASVSDASERQGRSQKGRERGCSRVSEYLYVKREGVTYLYLPEWEKKGALAVFSTRLGGVSVGSYGTLNLGLHVGDEKEKVITNRRLFMKAVGLRGEAVCAEQVHGDVVKRIGREDGGKGFEDYATSLPQTDGMITDEPGVALMAFFADCYPVYLFDPQKKAIGLVHSGWKGTVSKIACKAVNALQREFGSRVDDILAFIGPGIGPCCYSVGEEVADKFRKEFTHYGHFLYPKRQRGEYCLDLAKAIEISLLDVGVKTGNIKTARVCTSCRRDLFFSYRGEGGLCGRMGAALELR